MGMEYADIEIINYTDLGMVRKNAMDIDDVRNLILNVLCDSGA